MKTRIWDKKEIENLYSYLEYNEFTGNFYWKKDVGPINKKGKKAGFINNRYCHIELKGKRYLAHRLAWLFKFGKQPEFNIDHIDGIRDNNRIKNLRDIKHQSNLENLIIPHKDNKSNFLGVYFRNDTKKYTSQICIKSKKITLGSFLTAEEASNAYILAKRQYHTFCTI